MTTVQDAGPAPIIVSALFGREDFSWLDGLRRAHFPTHRNQLPPIEAPELAVLRAGLADAFPVLRVPQNAVGWRPHVTIQNKAQPA